MEQDGLEWSCPNCTKKKKGEDVDKESEKIKLLKEKMAQSIKEQQLKNKELQKSKNPNPGGKDRPGKVKNPSDLKQTKISDFSQKQATSSKDEENVGRLEFLFFHIQELMRRNVGLKIVAILILLA